MYTRMTAAEHHAAGRRFSQARFQPYRGMGDYEDDGLGRFKFKPKKIVKTLSKAVMKPTTLVTSSTLRVVGMRKQAKAVNRLGSSRAGTAVAFAAPGVADFDPDGLGKFSLKKTVKSITKAAVKVTKVVSTPIAYSVSAGLDAVGLRNMAGKVNKAVAVNKKELTALNKAAKIGGWGLDAAAVVAGSIVAAPAIAAAGSAVAGAAGSAASAVGGFLTSSGGYLAAGMKLLPKALPALEGMFGKKSSTPAPDGSSGQADTAAEIANDAGQAATALANTPAGIQPNAGSIGADAGGGGGGGGGSAAPDQAVNPDGTVAEPAKKSSAAWLLLIPFGALLL